MLIQFWQNVKVARFVQAKSKYSKLSNLTPGTHVGIMLTESCFIQLFIDGVAEEPLQYAVPSGQPCYAVFDLYGQCQQVGL